MIVFPTKAVRLFACCRFWALAFLLLGDGPRPAWAAEKPTSPTKPSAEATVAGRELKISATGQPGEIELTSDGKRLATANLPKNVRGITELRLCRWQWLYDGPPGVAAAIEAESADGGRSYFWATFSPSPQAGYELQAIDEFLTRDEDFDLVGVVNSSGDSIYVTLLRHSRDRGPDKFAGYLFVHNCPRAPLKGTLLHVTAEAVAPKPVGQAPATGLPRAEPEEAGMSSPRLAEIDRTVDEALAARKMPGCVVLIARHGRIVFLRAYGRRSLEPAENPMMTDTVFDLASLTKPIATATSVMLLVEEGKLALDEPVAKYLPEFAQNGKEPTTVRQLLTHQGGLIADNELADYADGPEKAIERVLATKPQAGPGEKFVYSDVGFIVLGELVRRVAGESLDRFAAARIFQPLGLAETGYLPAEELRQRGAPTEKRDGHWMRGEVHDPRAFALGGAAGHAGLFSTAEDVAVYAQMLLEQGKFGGVRILQPETVAEMTRRHEVPRGWRALGWDMRTGYSSNRGSNFSDRAFGHGGFTGTSLWIDPEFDLVVIFLSNRVHPDGKGLVNPLAGRIGTIAAEAVVREQGE